MKLRNLFLLTCLCLLYCCCLNKLMAAAVTKESVTTTMASTTPLMEQVFYLPLQSAPFPYDGEFGDTGAPFFDSRHGKTGEAAHTNRYGEKIPESRYADNRVMFFLPPGFMLNKPFFYLVFFHGLPSNPRDEFIKHRLERQLKASEKNVILLLPPLASNAADASPGKFFRKGAFGSFMNEVATGLAGKFPQADAAIFASAPVIVSAFSGGYKSAAYVVDRGELDERIMGILLFDALFEDVDKFSNWLLKNSDRAFFMHLFGKGSCERNSQILIKSLQQQNISVATNWPTRLIDGAIHFICIATPHNDVARRGPPADPVAKALAAIPGYNKQGDKK